MPRPIFAPHHNTEVQLSATALRPREESGDIAREAGLLPARQHQLPRERTLPSWHVAYIHPPFGCAA